jgi:hypothetical protein
MSITDDLKEKDQLPLNENLFIIKKSLHDIERQMTCAAEVLEYEYKMNPDLNAFSNLLS